MPEVIIDDEIRAKAQAVIEAYAYNGGPNAHLRPGHSQRNDTLLDAIEELETSFLAKNPHLKPPRMSEDHAGNILARRRIGDTLNPVLDTAAQTLDKSTYHPFDSTMSFHG